MTTLETLRLLLRRLQPADLDDYHHAIYGDPDVMATLPSGQTLTRQAFEAYVTPFMVKHWEKHGFGPWVAIYKPENHLIGHCGIKYWSGADNEVEVFFAFDKRYWGRGLATEGAQAAVRYGFEQVGLDHIIGYALTTNIGSRRVLEKIGLEYVGNFPYRERVWARYSLRRQDYEGQ